MACTLAKPDDRIGHEPAPYRSTPEFDENSLPAALRARHRTKPGVWGLIRVTEGRLALTRLDPPSEEIVTPDRPAVLPPGQPHCVAPLGPMRVRIEFYDRPPLPG